VPTLVFEHPYFTQTYKALEDTAVFLHRCGEELRDTVRYQVLLYRVLEVLFSFLSGRMDVLDTGDGEKNVASELL
jgi:hypothetical protein